MSPYILVLFSSAHANRLGTRFKVSKAVTAFKSLADWMFHNNAMPETDSCDYCGEPAIGFGVDHRSHDRRTISMCDDCLCGQSEPFDAYDHVRDLMDPVNHNVDAEKMEFWCGDD